MSEFKPTDTTAMDYTLHASEVAELRRYQEQGTQRHLIGRDTPILEGIYGGSYGGEAITIDYNSDPEPFDLALADVKQRATVTGEDGQPKIDKNLILNSVFDVVLERMKYSQAGVDEVFQESGNKDHQKISLGVYIDRGEGVCRHQALFAGAMLEKLGQEGVIRGKASVDRSVQWSEAGDPGGHAWVRYTNSAGEVIIVDPAQKFIGTLDEASARSHGWNYLRPDEDEARRRAIAGQHATETMQEQGLITGVPDHLRIPPPNAA